MDVLYNGVYSIDIRVGNTTYNTWTDLHLVPLEKPIIIPPTPNMEIIQMDDDYYLDLDSTYDILQGEWKFIIDHNKWTSWIDAYNFFLSKFHGRKAIISLGDTNEYTAYLEISDYSSEDDYSTISIGYHITSNEYNYDQSANITHTDRNDYSQGPTSDFYDDNGLVIDYDDVPEELPDPDDSQSIEPVRLTIDPEPYTEDGWELCESGYMSPEGGVGTLNNKKYVIASFNGLVDLNSKRTDGGIRYRIHIYTNISKLKHILFYDYITSWEYGFSFTDSEKLNNYTKLSSGNVRRYLKMQNGAYVNERLNIGIEYDPSIDDYSIFSYFIYVDTSSTIKV